MTRSSWWSANIRGFSRLRAGPRLVSKLQCSIPVRHSLSLLDAADKSTEAVAKEILSYFLRNPQAADSLTGIARWRLLEEAVQGSVTKTEAALQWLLEQGYLRQVQMRGDEGVFSLNLEKRDEAESFLNQRADEKEQ